MDSRIEKKSPSKGTKTFCHASPALSSCIEKIPEKGDENIHAPVSLTHVFTIEKRSPRKGTKT